MQAVSGCGSLLCLGHALAQCSGVARPSSTLATAVQTSCAHRMCSIPVWQLSTATASLGPGGYGFGSGFACEVRHRTAHAPRPSPGIWWTTLKIDGRREAILSQSQRSIYKEMLILGLLRYHFFACGACNANVTVGYLTYSLVFLFWGARGPGSQNRRGGGHSPRNQFSSA